MAPIRRSLIQKLIDVGRNYEIVTPENRHPLCFSGVYFLLRVDYVGISNNIENRLIHHHVFDRVDHPLIIGVEENNRDTMLSMEREACLRYLPPQNSVVQRFYKDWNITRERLLQK